MWAQSPFDEDEVQNTLLQGYKRQRLNSLLKGRKEEREESLERFFLSKDVKKFQLGESEMTKSQNVTDKTIKFSKNPNKSGTLATD